MAAPILRLRAPDKPPPTHPHLQAQVGGAPLNGIALIWVAVVYIDCTRAQVKEDPPV